MTNPHGPLRVGIGGPVGSGKTALMDALCKALRGRYEIAAITNDIYTKWDAEYLVRTGALPSERIAGVETGGCPHTAIREDASINLADRRQSERDGVPLLHTDVPHVRRHLRHVVAVQGAPLRSAALASAASIEGRTISLFCLSLRKVPPPASEPGHARPVLPLR